MKKLFIVFAIALAVICISFFLFSFYLPFRITSMAKNRFDQWKETYGERKALEMTTAWLKKQGPVIRNAIAQPSVIAPPDGHFGSYVCILYWILTPPTFNNEANNEGCYLLDLNAN